MAEAIACPCGARWSVKRHQETFYCAACGTTSQIAPVPTSARLAQVLVMVWVAALPGGILLAAELNSDSLMGWAIFAFYLLPFPAFALAHHARVQMAAAGGLAHGKAIVEGATAVGWFGVYLFAFAGFLLLLHFFGIDLNL